MYERWDGLYLEIYTLVQREENVPTAMLKEFFNYMIPEKWANKIEESAEISKAWEEISAFLIANPEYNSIPLDKVPKHLKNTSIETTLRTAILVYFMARRLEREFDKDSCFHHFYEILRDFFDINTSPKKRPTQYKLAVLAARLAGAAEGYRYTSKSNPTNQQLYQGVKNSLNKFLQSKK